MHLIKEKGLLFVCSFLSIYKQFPCLKFYEGLKKTFVLEFFTMLNVKMTRGGDRKNINNSMLITVMKYRVMIKQTHQLLFILEN